MNRKFLNKFLIITIILLITIFGFFTSSFAVDTDKSTYTSDYFSFIDSNLGLVKYSIPDNCVNYTISYYKQGFSFCYTDNPNARFAVYNINKYYQEINCYSNDTYTETVPYYRLKNVSSEWDLYPVYREDLGCYFLDFKNSNIDNNFTYSTYFNDFYLQI